MLSVCFSVCLCLIFYVKIQSGAQVMQVFESWAHHLTEEQFITFAKVFFFNKYINSIRTIHFLNFCV